jgi:hypothetical protein
VDEKDEQEELLFPPDLMKSFVLNMSKHFSHTAAQPAYAAMFTKESTWMYAMAFHANWMIDVLAKKNPKRRPELVAVFQSMISGMGAAK